jgi:hypothetical protein
MAATTMVLQSYYINVVIILMVALASSFKGTEAQRAFFVFGDSLVDNGITIT